MGMTAVVEDYYDVETLSKKLPATVHKPTKVCDCPSLEREEEDVVNAATRTPPPPTVALEATAFPGTMKRPATAGTVFPYESRACTAKLMLSPAARVAREPPPEANETIPLLTVPADTLTEKGLEGREDSPSLVIKE